MPLYGQYITFCRVFDKLRKDMSDPKEALRLAFEICMNENVLRDLGLSEDKINSVVTSM